jgi:hypothetical protein
MEKSTATLGALTAVIGLALLGLLSAIGFGSVPRGKSSLAGDATASFVSSVNHSLEAKQLLSHGRSGMLGASDGRLARLEAAIHPIFTALPKSREDSSKVEQAAARYALHRLFSSNNWWNFKEFRSSGKGQGPEFFESEFTVESKVADLVADVLEADTGDKLVSLEDLGVLAAAVEYLVRGESTALLMKAYQVIGLSHREPINVEQRRHVLDAFIVLLIGDEGGENGTLHDELDVAKARAIIKRNKDGKDLVSDTMLWASDFETTVRHQVGMRNPFTSASEGPWNFPSMAELGEDIITKVGRVSASDCSSLKRQLLDVEERHGATSLATEGSIDLDLFFNHHLMGLGLARSKAERYLAPTGALDTTDPKNPRVIVSNYVLAAQLCLPTPGAITMCCINECNALMESLERSIARPSAAPGIVGSVAAALESTSVVAPRELPSFLLRGLDRIAAQHGRQVPLHSKAFALWMHRAFPAECPNPAIAGEGHAPWVGEAFVESLDSSQGFMMKKEARQHMYDASDGSNETSEMDRIFQSDEEELDVVAERHVPRPQTWTCSWRSLLSLIGLVSMVVASVIVMRQHFSAAMQAVESRDGKGGEGFFI